MFKSVVKYILLLTFFIGFAATRVFAQITLDIGNVINSGSYAPGSTISVPFHINNSGNINDDHFAQSNTFSLYISDVGGATFSTGPVAVINGFYGNFINYTVPTGLAPGFYKFKVVASNPAVQTNLSNSVFIDMGTAPTAGTTTTNITTEVFGRCTGTQSTPYFFSNTSSSGSTVTVSFFDESGNTSVPVGAAQDITNTDYAFAAGAKNYRVTVTATDDVTGIISTKSYILINNTVITSLGSTGNNIVCIDPVTHKAVFTFLVDISAAGIKNNYPGDIYTVTWGDGSSTKYTYGDLVASGGVITNAYTTVSCGQVGITTATNNRFRVDLNAGNPYCGTIGSPATNYATVVQKPVNKIGTPAESISGSVCSGSSVTFVNLSIPGPDAASTNIPCVDNPNARYAWLVDGIVVLNNAHQHDNFTYANIPRGTGTHTITLRDITGNGQCFADDIVYTLCVQTPPQPSFTITTPICLSTPFSPTNTSLVDNNCTVSNYTWKVFKADGVTAATGITFAGGTDYNSITPQFIFAAAGIYKLQLFISSANCGNIQSAQQQLTVEATPTAALSPDFSLCAPQTLTFDPTNGSQTKVTFTGTPTTGATNYTWNVTGGAWHFAVGFDLHSQYPKIVFEDLATYTVTVKHTNSCDPVGATATQHITIQAAPIPDAGSPQTICQAANVQVNLSGNIGGVYDSYQWSIVSPIAGTGTLTGAGTFTPVFTPTTADFAHGSVTLRLTAITNALPSPCNSVTSDVVITLVKKTTITPPLTKTICSGDNVNYTIATNNDGLTPAPTITYAWTATVTSGTVTGLTAGTGTTQLINDALVNTTPTVAASVTYHITATTNGCPGTPADLVVTLNPVPIITPSSSAAVCNGSGAGITLASNVSNTKYTWTVTAPAGSGATAQTSPIATTSINQTLTNSTTSAITVTYNITPYNGNGCPGAPFSVSVDVNPPTPTATITGAATQNVCDQNAITLTGNTPGGTFTGQWTQVPAAGVPTATIVAPTNPVTDITGLVSGFTYTFKWTINGFPPCGDSFATVQIIDNLATVGGTTATLNPTTVCSGSNSGTITLNGETGNVKRWERSTDGVTFTTVSPANTSHSLSYSNLTTNTYYYRAIVQNGPNCTEEPSAATIITVNPPTPTAVITGGPTQNLCSATGVTLIGNVPGGTFTGQWIQVAVAGVPTATIDNPTSPTTTVSNMVPGNNYTFRWTINGFPPCGDSFADITINDNLATVGGTTATLNPTTVCSGSNSGTITLSDETGTVKRWEKSTDGVTFTTVSPANTSHTLLYSNLTTTTYYRAVVQNGPSCMEEPSTVTTITVNPPTPTAVITGGPSQNLCSATGVTLIGNVPGGTFTGQWTQVAVAGVPTATIDNPTSPTTTVSNMVPGNNYTFRWTINGFPPCGDSFADITINDNLATVGGTTATLNPTTVCSGSNSGTITLSDETGTVKRWEKSTDGVTFTTVSPANTSHTLLYSNLTTNTYYYRAIVQNGANCTEEPSSVTTITVNPPTPTAVITGGNQQLCNSTTTTLVGNVPGGTFTGQWIQVVVAGVPTATIDNPTSPTTTVSNLVPGNTYTFRWTINGFPPCGDSFADITVDDFPATIGGTTSTSDPATVCSGSNSGTINLSGQEGTILGWEQSTDGGNTWTAILNTTIHQPFNNLTTTTQFRAVIKSGPCTPEQQSTATTITVNPPAPVANAGPGQILCNAATVTLTANDPGTFPGLWTQTAGPPVSITNANNYQTTVTGLTGGNTYTFAWTITALAPCTNTSDQVTIQNSADVVPTFTANNTIGCGNLTVQFTNTSNNQAGASFLWNFGDGTTSTLVNPQHLFPQRTDGKDTTYTVSLNVIGNCTPHPDAIQAILVRPAVPIASILPASTDGCGNFALEVRNTSPGNNISYDFYLYDGATLIQKITTTTKDNVIFDPIATIVRKTFTLYMIATGYCNTSNETTHIPIVISPSTVTAQFFLQNDMHAGCAPFNTIFVNNSFGGSTFYYTIYDANNNIVDKPIASTTSLPYTFNTPGTYYVTITAVNSCGINQSPRTRVDVYPVPKPAFVADVTTGCKDVRITFTNNTISNEPGTPASSLLYDWDFGDGSTHSALFQPTHAYHFTNTPYTVTLTATNTASGCSAVVSRQSYIVLTGPPLPAFSVRPDSVTSIPNYTFSFVDESTRNPASWIWKFSDGRVSLQRNPTITFADTGVYKVSLTTATAIGCDTTITKSVRITGVPGQLYLPNAFIPTSGTTELQKFKAKGSGIKQWHLQIFNNYGQLMWETTQLTSKGEPVGEWDGTFKGVPMPQGVYQWQASATFINGTEWKGNSYNNELPKRVGSIHLIR